LTRDGTVHELSAQTTYPLGILERERVLPTATAQLRSGDRLLLYSDGIIETQLEDGSRFGAERLEALLLESSGLPPATAVKAIERAVIDATGGRIGDDATQLLLAVD
jgi:serine phosphatase RsbU (regulator of sigma subunit)